MMHRTAVVLTTVLIATFALVCVAAVADDAGQCSNSLFTSGTLFQRLDMSRGAEPSWTTAWLDQSGWEFWSFCQPNFPLYEFGRLWPVKANKSDCLLLGGYLSWWDEVDQAFLEPFWVYNHPFGDNWSVETAGGAYVPLNNGSWVFYTNQVAVSHPLSKSIRAGVFATNWWQEGVGNSIGIGPKLEISSGDTSWLFRYAWGVSGGVPDVARVEFSVKLD